MNLIKKTLNFFTLLMLTSGAFAATTTAASPTAQQFIAAGEKTCKSDTKCWREFALLQRSQAQTQAGLYWMKVEQRHKNGQGKAEAKATAPCKENDLACWKNFAEVASTTNAALTALYKIDDPEGVGH
ncbi:hypothetical protein ACFFU8_09395 [Chromobacterium piscinae]|uniref:hypothetical protein n=1 Tax=Chromobacterium piscinae TaxID=686831 RepID=UPI001E34FA79|nr:hypothetical protein [Chromobacterium piscinae]MCD5327881.1 hypothetical protein [Chromobacterium piscinae]